MVLLFFKTRVSTYSEFLFTQTVQLGSIGGERVEDTLHKTVLIGFNPLPARGCHTKSCLIFLSFLFCL